VNSLDHSQPLPEEAASQLLAKNGGDQRGAEVEAWSYAAKFQNPNEPGRTYWVQVVRAIVDGEELPRVTRTDRKPVPGFRSRLTEHERAGLGDFSAEMEQ
jgi:hypothetical protein